MKKLIVFTLMLALFSTAAYSQAAKTDRKAQPSVVETKDGFEFKNLKLSKEDEAALSKMYENQNARFRVSKVRNQEVVESYGKADVRKVSIVSSGNGGTDAQQINWIVKKTVDNRWIDEQCITYLTVGLSSDQIDKIRRILSKYDPSVAKGK